MSATVDPTTVRPGRDTRSSASDGAARGAAPLVLTLLWCPDRARVGQQAVLAGVEAGLPGQLSRRTPHFGGPGAPAEPLGHPRISRAPLSLAAGSDASVQLRYAAERFSVRVDGAAAPPGALLSAEALDRGAVLEVGGALVLHLRRRPAPALGPDHGLAGCSPQRDRLLADIAAVASTPHAVLVRGETGTGKELVARALHAASGRLGRFLAVNVATLRSGTAMSQLFGHARGAFTGAQGDHDGWFRAADGGTLLLDEIGELSLELQAALLRVLDEGLVHPVGGRPVPCDTRVVAATDAPLERLADQGRLLPPLLHRLAACTVRTAPLRERVEDIPVLYQRFVRAEQARAGQSDPSAHLLERPVLRAILAHPWPGNVRELRNVAVQAVVFGDPWRGMPAGASNPGPPPAAPPAPAARPPRARSDAELAEALRAHGWEVAGAARALGMARNTLVSRMRRSARFTRADARSADELAAALDAAEGDVRAAAHSLELSERAFRHRARTLGLALP